MRAMRSAAALLRGAAGLAVMSQVALPAGAGALAAAELARRLDQGCAARHAATAAGGDESGRGPPKRRAPNVGKQGEKTADGKPKPDERTVADLVRRGWFESEEAAVALLTRANTSNQCRYAFETAEPAADWLEATLGHEPMKDGLCPAARAVTGNPLLLACDVPTLQRKWDALTLPAGQGGVGIAFSTEQAREAVSKYPQILGYKVETFKTGWSMLLSTDGLDQTPEEARECILRSPNVLKYDNNEVVRRIKLLESLGYVEARSMVLAEPRVLGYKEETVRRNAAWWKQSGLDHVKRITSQPTLLGASKATELQAKLDFLSRVVGLSIEEMNNAGHLFTCSLDGRLRTRYFYALQKQALGGRFGFSTLMVAPDAGFLAMMQGRPFTQRASEAEVKRYREEVASPEFVAWRAEQEARILQRPLS